VAPSIWSNHGFVSLLQFSVYTKHISYCDGTLNRFSHLSTVMENVHICAQFEKSHIVDFACAYLYVTVEGIKSAVFVKILCSIFNVLFSQLLHFCIKLVLLCFRGRYSVSLMYC
jgi:hypothetical protein